MQVHTSVASTVKPQKVITSTNRLIAEYTQVQHLLLWN